MIKHHFAFIFLAIITIASYGFSQKKLMSRRQDQFMAKKNQTDSLPGKTKKDPIVEDIKRLMLPVPPSFSPADSARLIANWTTGIKFYKANCAKCHGIFGKGRDSIPNFSKEQMDDYASAALAGDKQNHAVMSKMTMDELNAVFLFISNVKR